MKKSVFQYLLFVCFIVIISFLATGCGSDEEEMTNSGNNGNYSHELSVGASSNDLLSNDNYETLVVEIQYATGYAPPQSAIDNLKTMLSNRVNKLGGITVTTSEIAAPGKTTYSINDLRIIEDKNRTAFTHDNTIATYFFFADGGYSEDTNDSKVLGVAHRNTSMVIFQKTIDDYSGGVNQPSEGLLTSTVINHEFGHILGLVNNGTDMASNHQDTAHGAHCNQTECLMFWQAETTGGLSDLLGMSSPPDFDAQCIADLQGNGGK